MDLIELSQILDDRCSCPEFVADVLSRASSLESDISSCAFVENSDEIKKLRDSITTSRYHIITPAIREYVESKRRKLSLLMRSSFDNSCGVCPECEHFKRTVMMGNFLDKHGDVGSKIKIYEY